MAQQQQQQHQQQQQQPILYQLLQEGNPPPPQAHMLQGDMEQVPVVNVEHHHSSFEDHTDQSDALLRELLLKIPHQQLAQHLSQINLEDVQALVNDQQSVISKNTPCPIHSVI